MIPKTATPIKRNYNAYKQIHRKIVGFKNELHLKNGHPSKLLAYKFIKT
jgi:hypothetical protein